MKPEEAESPADWPDDPDQWPDIEPLDITFEEAVARLAKVDGKPPFLKQADDVFIAPDEEPSEARFRLSLDSADTLGQEELEERSN